MEMQWLSKALKMKVRRHFQEKYKKRLSDKEIIDIAENLTGYMEMIIKFKLRYEKNNHDLQQA